MAVKSPSRNSSLDVWRGVAILAVVVSHFHGPEFYGRLGVDLFFVLSGYLIGGILLKQYESDQGIQFWRFLVKRGFKIWPSYYLFLILSLFLSAWLIAPYYPVEEFPVHDSLKYFLFYANYAFLPFKYFFMHLWSLSVEEHFYLLLPCLLLFGRFIRLSHRGVLILIISTITIGIISSIFNWFTHHSVYEYLYYTSTHTRIDGLAFGVLLATINGFFPRWLILVKSKWLFLVGLVLITITIYLRFNLSGEWYRVIFYHTLSAISFTLLIAGSLNTNLGNYHFFRAMGYYSYNWYLWHLWVFFFFTPRPNDLINLVIYLVISFGVAVFFTVLVEEPFLRIRKRVLP